ncbi:MAG: CpsD/CapB family tyrosine-protein kinase [Christensenellales bacterium]|nr:CpsD/CapB family tyrosine-protein kinase [Christensenellales bacterium]
MRKATIKRFTAPDYSGTEAINTICTNLSFSGRNCKRIAFTSYMPGAGKTYISVNVLYNLAKRGKRVLLVDADLRRSNIVSRLRMETDGEMLGLAHYLAGHCNLDDCIYETNLYGACIMPAGRDITSPMTLIDTPYFGEMLDHLATQFDLILVDTPPVGVVIDAAEIGRRCDGCVLIVNYNTTRRRELVEAKNQMEQSGCPILGCVINKVTFDTLSAKKYYNKGYYNHYYKSGYYGKSNDE